MESKYSVLMTVYNKDNPDYFRLALSSMTGQTLRPDEIVIVKDGPVPETIQSIIDMAEIEYPHLIVQVQLPQNVGLGLALNAGLKVCKNELVARMDADDISLPERCEKQIAEFITNPALDIIGSPVIEFDGTPQNSLGVRNVPLDNDSIYKFCRKRDPFNHPTVMYRKSKVAAAGYYSDLRKNQDTDLWIRMLAKDAECSNLAQPVLYFRFNENTYKKRKNWLNTKILIGIRWKAFCIGFCSFMDFLEVAVMQSIVFVMPIYLQRFVYRNLLR